MPDGMDELLARREVGKGRRYVPTSKHPKAAVSTARQPCLSLKIQLRPIRGKHPARSQ